MYLFVYDTYSFEGENFNKLKDKKQKIKVCKNIFNSEEFKTSVKFNKYLNINNIISECGLEMKENNMAYYLSMYYYNKRYLNNTSFENTIPMMKNYIKENYGIKYNKNELEIEVRLNLVEDLIPIFRKFDEFLISKGVTIN